MQITKWQVWLSYISNMFGDLDLGALSRRLVDDDVCVATYRPYDSSFTYKNDKQETVSSSLYLTKEIFSSSASIVLPPELSEQSFAIQCLFLSVYMDMHEKHLRNQSTQAEYLRGYLGEHRLRFGDNKVLVYPSFKLYADGTVITHLRVLSPESAVSTEQLIDNVVNLGLVVPDDVYLDASACRGYLASFFKSTSWWTRNRPFGRAKWIEGANSLVESLVVIDDVGEYEVRLVSMKELKEKLEIHDAGDFHLRSLAEHIQSMIFESAVESTTSVRFAPSWFGMPTVHLIEFSDQPEISDSFTDEHFESFEKICNRTSVPLGFGKVGLGDDLRPFDDYSMFVSNAAILFALGSKHVEKTLNDDPNAIDSGQQDWVIYDKQIIAEFVLHLRARLLRWDDLSLSADSDNASLRRLEFEMINLDRNFVDISSFGEINKLLEKAVDTLGLKKFSERIRASAQFRVVEAAEQQEQLTRKLGWSLTILIGLIGIPGLSNGLVEPLWDIWCWWRPERSSVADVFFFGISTVSVLSFVFLSWKVIKWCSKYDRRR